MAEPQAARKPESSGAGARSAPRSARRRAREFALQGLYQWLLAAGEGGAIEAHLAETPGFEKADKAYFDDCFHGVLAHAEALRAAVTPHLDRPVGELSPVEHAILLLGAYELTWHPEVPYRVVINEAVELAKSFGGTDGFKYVNGVLDKLAPALRATEVRARTAR